MQHSSDIYAILAPLLEQFEPLGREGRVARLTHLEPLMDVLVRDERCRVWSATVIWLEPDGSFPASALVVGPRFPQDEEPEEFELSGVLTNAMKESEVPGEWQGYAVHGSILGWAGLIRETGWTGERCA